MLAMAYALETANEEEQYPSAADGARPLGVTRARMSQLMRRRWAPVAEQDRILPGGSER